MNEIINCLGVSFTYCLIYSGLSAEKSVRDFLLQFFLCAAVYAAFMLLNIERYFIFPFTLVSGLMGKNSGEFLFTLFKAFTAMMIFSLYILIAGNIIIPLFPGFRGNKFYDVFMAAFSILFSVIVYFLTAKKDTLKHLYRNEKVVKKCIVIESVFMVLFSFVLPLILKINEGEYSFISVYILSSATIISFFYMSYYLAVSESTIIMKERQRQYEDIGSRIIEEKYKDIISLKHYYNKLYQMLNDYIVKNDWQGLREYFLKYISLLHENIIDKDYMPEYLTLIEPPLIKNLLSDTAFRARSIYGIKLIVDIAGKIDGFFIPEMDFFIILNEWISNAFDAVKNRDGYVQISITEDSCALAVKVVNPMYEEVNISLINRRGFTTKPGHTGCGLADTEKIIAAHKNLEHMNHITMGKFIQCLIIRGHTDE